MCSPFQTNIPATSSAHPHRPQPRSFRSLIYCVTGLLTTHHVRPKSACRSRQRHEDEAEHSADLRAHVHGLLLRRLLLEPAMRGVRGLVNVLHGCTLLKRPTAVAVVASARSRCGAARLPGAADGSRTWSRGAHTCARHTCVSLTGLPGRRECRLGAYRRGERPTASRTAFSKRLPPSGPLISQPGASGFAQKIARQVSQVPRVARHASAWHLHSGFTDYVCPLALRRLFPGWGRGKVSRSRVGMRLHTAVKGHGCK